MNRTIVICCDGTGNTFDDRTTNVTRLVRVLDMSDHTRQVTVYAQGVGTNGARHDKLTAFRRSISDPDALHVVRPPRESQLAKFAGLTIGYGIKESVRGMYEALAEHHSDAQDRIYLFGFSRGAFAVRALAGLIYRCGLPQPGTRPDFDHVWDRYT